MALPLIPSKDERDRFHREGVMPETSRASIPWDGEPTSTSSASGAGRFFPVVTGRDAAAASEVVLGVRGGRGGGRCCSGV